MAEAQVATLQVTTLNLDELKEVIRSVVREEITEAMEAHGLTTLSRQSLSRGRLSMRI